jgi:hypothetical protein
VNLEHYPDTAHATCSSPIGCESSPIVIDPERSTAATYVPDPPSSRGSSSSTPSFNAHQGQLSFGPAMVLLHEFVHNTTGKKDEPTSDTDPGPTVNAVNAVQRGLGLPQRLQYESKLEVRDSLQVDPSGARLIPTHQEFRTLLFQGGIMRSVAKSLGEVEQWLCRVV